MIFISLSRYAKNGQSKLLTTFFSEILVWPFSSDYSKKKLSIWKSEEKENFQDWLFITDNFILSG